MVKSPMHKTRCRISQIDIADLLRIFAILVTIVMAIAFFAGCVTEQLDSDGVYRKRDANREIHGGMSVGYGRSG